MINDEIFYFLSGIGFAAPTLAMKKLPD